MKDSQPTATASAPPRVWPLFLAGVLLFIVGPAAYVAQINMHRLWMPWYVPVLASLGVLLMAASVWKRPGILRIAGLVLFVLACAGEWFMVLVATKSPVYVGPALPGNKVPAFSASLADGRAFTNQDLEKGVSSVLVFFRGRW